MGSHRLASCFATVSALALVWACSSSGPRLAEPAGDASVPPIDASMREGGDAAPAVRDADPEGSNGDGSTACNGVSASGGSIAMTYVPGSRPAPVGGAIGGGTYVLTERATFIDDFEGDPMNPPPDTPVTRTIVVSGTTLQIAELGPDPDGGAPTTLHSTTTFQIFDTTLSQTNACPFSGGAPANNAFSVVGNDLWIFPTQYSRELYTKQ